MKRLHNIRIYLKQRFDSIGNERIRLSILQALPFWIASICTGLVAVLYTKLFFFAEQCSHRLIEWHRWIIFIQAPLFFFIGWWVVKAWAPYSRGSGIPQVMAATQLAIAKNKHGSIRKLLSIPVAFTKIVSSMFMVAGGAAIGREGPTIQVAGSIFSTIYKYVPKNWPKLSRANMIVAGAASGLAAAFNTPLGGIVFAVEELSKSHISNYRTALFSGVIIAGLVAQTFLGPYLYLGYPDVSNLSPYVLLLVLLVAALGGILGSGMTKIILTIMRWRKKLKQNQQLLFLMGCAFGIAFLVYFVNADVMGSGKEIMMNLLFTNNKTPEAHVFPLRFIGPLLSFTTGGAGGVFAPGLTSGATLGALVGNWFHMSDSNINLLILAGMVAFLTGITRTPFTSAILVLEMTDRHGVIFHLMLAGLIAGLTSLIVDKKAFYDHLKHDFLNEVKQEEEAESKARQTS
ncbi:chloride channel protein [Chitinophagaceae bacterium LWZ2-11]